AVLAGAIGWTDALAVVGRAVVREASLLIAGSGGVVAVGGGQGAQLTDDRLTGGGLTGGGLGSGWLTVD
uniref:hypothetical protein n=1 Tax=Streptomyces cyaneofuscatus TaxID=66883 RepID=UPI002FEFCB1B